ncbi:hypothetical protein LCGC14_1272360 [marine sediment metagenome]|uniref:Uncharacterized protein n=1 Tax=marine sediment metagenome TaxID=412755 RepID=A0A0F9KXS5_9ZZZZ
MKLKKRSIEFDARFKDLKFSDNFLLKGTFAPTKGWTKVQFQHSIELLSYKLINPNERKIIFHFRLVMRPDLGEISFDGEFILESPEQNKIEFLIHNAFPPLRKLIDIFILKYSYSHAESLAKRENIFFPPAKEILKRFGIK